MRLLSTLLSALLLLSGSNAASRVPGNSFEEFHRLALSTSPLVLSTDTFTALTATPRDYSVAVVFTALDPRFKCTFCLEFDPEWRVLGHSWAQGDRSGESRLILATLDFSEGRDIFIKFGLTNAPILMFFPPTAGPHATASPEPLQYDFSSGMLSAEAAHTWLSKQLPGRPHPPVKRPVDVVKIVSITAVVLGIAMIIFAVGPYLLPLLSMRNLWASITLIAILLFTTGHMFNQIRGAPYVAGDGKGGVQYITPNFSSQLGVETQIIAVIYGIMAFCAISLATKVPRMAEPKSQLVAALGWTAILFVLNSLLLSVFRVKNSGYPFSLPPFM